MQDDEHEDGGHTWQILIACITILPILYVLSIGPAAVLKGKYNIDHRPFEIFYFPLCLLHEYTPLEKPLDDYIQWWSPKSLEP